MPKRTKKSISIKDPQLLAYAMSRSNGDDYDSLSSYLCDLILADMEGRIKHKGLPEGRPHATFVWEGVVVNLTQTRDAAPKNSEHPA